MAPPLLADSPRLLALNELIRPVVMVLLTNALRLETRLMMSSGAITYSIHSHIRRPVRRSHTQKSTNLSLSKNGQESIRGVVANSPRSDEQQ